MNIFSEYRKILKSIKFDNIKPKQISDDSVVIPVDACHVGTFKGYSEGEIELTEEMFGTIIENFEKQKSPPPFLMGHSDVNGSADGKEAPAYGYVLGLKLEDNHLFALVELTKQMEQMIEDGMFKFTSIFAMPDNDRVTGEPIGERLFSLAATNQPFIDGQIPMFILSEKNQTNNFYLESSIYKKEKTINMAKTKVKIALSDELEVAEVAAETMEGMQEGKTEEVDPMDLLEKARGEMPLVDFIKHLLDLAKAETAEEVVAVDEVVEAEGEDAEVEAETEDLGTEEVVAAKALSKSILSLNIALSKAQAKIKALEEKEAKHEELVLSSVVTQAVRSGKILDVEKDSFLELGKTNKALFDKMMSVRGVKPSVVLSRITSADVTPNSMESTSKLSGLSEAAKKMAAGAGIKV